MTRTRAAVLTLLVAPLAVLAVLVAGTGPASAHASLTGSDPTDGATLATAPAEVSFTFNEDIRDPAFVVVTADGQRVAQGEAQVDANVVTARVAPDAPAGTWTAAFRVVSTDGHAVTGEITFDVEAPAEQPSEQPSEQASDQPSDQPSAGPGAGAESTQSEARSATDSDDSGGDLGGREILADALPSSRWRIE